MKAVAKNWNAAWAVVALAGIVLAYANSFGNAFHFDDFHTIVDNPYIRSLHNIPRFFRDANTFSVLPANRTYRPLVSASLAIDYALGRGYTPFWFHLGTFLVFIAQLGAMLVLFRCMLSRVGVARLAVPVSLFAVALYGLHPAIAETINYIIQRGDVFCAAGVIGALAFYARFPQARRWGVYLLPFVAAMLSKPPAIVFPLLLLAYVAYFEAPPESRWRQSGIAAVPSLAIGAGLLWLQSAMTPHTFTPAATSGWSYRLTQPFVLARYFGSFFLPVHLNVDTDLRPFTHFNPDALAGLVFLAALVSAIVFTARRRILKPISFGLLWFLLTSLPTSLYPLAEVENDHRMYLPFVGLAIAAASGLHLLAGRYLPSRVPRYVTTLGAALLLAPYAWGTHLRNQVWHTEESLWRDDVLKSPHNGRGLMIYGLTQMQHGRYPVALDYFQRALRETPNYATLEINLGVVYAAMGDDRSAQQHFTRAISLAPTDDQPHFFYGRWLLSTGQIPAASAQLQQAVELNPDRLAARDLLLQSLLQQGKRDEALRLAQQTLALFPDDAASAQLLHDPGKTEADTLVNASLQLYRRGDFAGAAEAAQTALRANPQSEVAWNNLGAAYAGLGKYADAVSAEQRALAIRPDFQLARNNLAAYTAMTTTEDPRSNSPEALLNRSLLLYQARHYAESKAAAQCALALRPGYPEALNNIAADDAALGHWDAAIAAANGALKIKPDFTLARNNLAWALSGKAASGK